MVSEFFGQDVVEDFEILVRMGWEFIVGFYMVFIENVQRIEVVEVWVVLVSEGEGVVGVELVVVGVILGG